MDLTPEDWKNIGELAKPFIEPLVSKALSGKFVSRRKETEDLLRKYITRAYTKFSSLNVLVFPNQQIQIKSIYQPLTLKSSKDNKTNKLGKIERSFVENYQKILISDSAGMGKSTLMKWIGLSLIETKLSIPILIELKKLNKERPILDEFQAQINGLDGSLDLKVMLNLVEHGRFTFLLDGFDEIPSDNRAIVIADLQEFITNTTDNWFFLTSRPDSMLAAFGDFQMFKISPLKKNESYELLRKYDSVSGLGICDNLIKDVETSYPQVNEFLTNPFLVSLLYKTYTYNKNIPSKKSSFYDEVYAALYKNHDLSKDGYKRDKLSKLDIQDFRLVLRRLAFNTAKLGKVEYTEQELLKYLDSIRLGLPGIDFKPSHFADDLVSTVPLFVRDGGVVKWAHKSVQDYFAAEFVSMSEDKSEIIKLIYKSQKDNYLNILDFLYEMEYGIIRRNILKELAQSYVTYYENSFVAIEGVDPQLVDIRKSLCFGNFYGFRSIGNPPSKSSFVECETEFEKRWPNELGKRYISKVSAQLANFYQIQKSTYYIAIIDLFGERGEDIAIRVRADLDNYLDIFKYCEHNEYYGTDDTRENLLNSVACFDKVNNFIYSIRRHNSGKVYCLSYTECLKLLDVLRAEEEVDDVSLGRSGI